MRDKSAHTGTFLRALVANCLLMCEIKYAGETISLGCAKDCNQMPWPFWTFGKETKCRTFETVENFIY